MKKILLPLFFLLTGLAASAQVCVPGTLTAPKNAYILPDSATNFANACPGTYYEQILYIKAAKDTAIATTIPIIGACVITARIDSFVVDATIVGLPSYLSIQSVPLPLQPAGASAPKSNILRLVIPGDSLACVKVSGNVPPGTLAATIPLTINLRVYLDSMHSTNAAAEFGIPSVYPGRKTDTLTGINDYRIVVYPTPCWPTAVNTISTYNFNLVGNVPNPSNSMTQIVFESNIAEMYTLQVVNTVGETIFSKKVQAAKGMNYIPVDTKNIASGIYIYSLSDGKNSVSKRMEVTN
jgi:hypothetical protein